MKLILLGAPGAGKGTQAQVLKEALGVPVISTGEMLREAIAQDTEMGRSAKTYLESGGLVPDEVVIGIISARVTQSDCLGGFILDGFPRTVAQAEALEAMRIKIDTVLMIQVMDEDILNRLSGRRICTACGASYHTLYQPTKKAGICDRCGGQTTQRADDAPDTVRERLRVYHESTSPVRDYYQAKGNLTVVQGQEEVADTTAMTLKAVGVGLR